MSRSTRRAAQAGTFALLLGAAGLALLTHRALRAVAPPARPGEPAPVVRPRPTLKLEDVEPSSIDVGESLFEGGLGLDSIDALEIGVALRKRYAITIETATDEVKSYFRSVQSLAALVRLKRGK